MTALRELAGSIAKTIALISFSYWPVLTEGLPRYRRE